MTKQRVDVLLVEQGLVPSRARAQALVLAGAVVESVSGRRLDKPGAQLADDVELRLKDQPLPYVSRGGLKLAAALERFAIDPRGRVCLDVGASTGGFTDCLLQHGASRVYAIDVGYNQLAFNLRQDPRVVVHERCNIRHAPPELVPEPCSLLVVDVSFISLKLVLPAARQFLAPGAVLAALVKPQFEVGRADVGKGGVVRDPAARQRALDEVATCAAELGFYGLQTLDSPILGAKGNHEFLLGGALAS
ncbi:MAG TPA: TlyA family RNA methyltransferase [Myxococcota bacterium]|nr:TlyA family RNA methyltransferase [Myxococcota bacterium]